MAKYWLIKNTDGTYSMQAQLRLGRRVLHQDSASKFAESDIGAQAKALATSMRKARIAHGLVQAGGDVPGETS